jgi:hypothetical protein
MSLDLDAALLEIESRYNKTKVRDYALGIEELGEQGRADLIAETAAHVAAWSADSALPIFVTSLNGVAVRVDSVAEAAEEDCAVLLEGLRQMQESRDDIPLLVTLLRAKESQLDTLGEAFRLIVSQTKYVNSGERTMGEVLDDVKSFLEASIKEHP